MPFIKGVWWYDFLDDGWDCHEGEHNSGIVRPDLTPKSACYVLAELAKLVSKAEYLGRMENDNPNIWVLKFRQDQTSQTWEIWSTHVDHYWQITLEHPKSNPADTLSLQIVGSTPVLPPCGYRAWAWVHQRTSKEMQSKQFSVAVRRMPVLIRGQMEGVKIKRTRYQEFFDFPQPVRSR